MGFAFISVNITNNGSAGRCKVTAFPIPGVGAGIRSGGLMVEAKVLLLWMESALLCLGEGFRDEGAGGGFLE